MTRAAEHQAALRSLFGPNVVTVCGDPRHPSEPLTASEAALVSRAVEKRRTEFAKGRECARRALASLGIHGFSLMSGRDREPLWPEGIVGTLTHCEGFCGVAVASRDEYVGLGLDAEPDEPIDEKLQERICTADELARLQTLPGRERGRHARLLFSAKEAFYKCQHTVSRQFLGFHDATVDVDREVFTVTLLRAAPPFGPRTKFQGAWRRAAGVMMTALALPADHVPNFLDREAT